MFLFIIGFIQNDSHEFRYMTAILRHCLLTLGPTEVKTEELHRLVKLQIQLFLKGHST